MEIQDQKLLHLHLSDSLGNKSTLVCRLRDGSIRYILYGGTGSSGTPFSLSNLQVSLPIENKEGESLEEFKNRVIGVVNRSTENVIKVVNTKVSFS
jgi:hypothetical protein